VSRDAELLLSLFHHAWGPSLPELCQPDAPPLALPAPLVDEARARGPALASGASATDVMDALLAFLWSRNQFVALELRDRRTLEHGIARALASLGAGAAVEAVLASHRAELAAVLRARLGESPREVVSAEYSPALQLAVLGLELSQLGEPILDVGCGPAALLVRHLRTLNLEAEGLDRAAPTDVATRGDWLGHDYGEGRFGTVLSHLGFSLHFLHHHLAGGDTAYDYARSYMAILRSLRIGGRFAYVPALPFLESMLDARVHRVTRVPLAESLRVSSLRQFEDASGLSLSQAVHVERLA